MLQSNGRFLHFSFYGALQMRTPEGDSRNIDNTHPYDHGYHSAGSQLCPGKGAELQQQLAVGPTLPCPGHSSLRPVRGVTSSPSMGAWILDC